MTLRGRLDRLDRRRQPSRYPATPGMIAERVAHWERPEVRAAFEAEMEARLAPMLDGLTPEQRAARVAEWERFYRDALGAAAGVRR